MCHNRSNSSGCAGGSCQLDLTTLSLRMVDSDFLSAAGKQKPVLVRILKVELVHPVPDITFLRSTCFGCAINWYCHALLKSYK